MNAPLIGLFVISGLLAGCSNMPGQAEDLPLGIEPTPAATCSPPREITIEDLESFPGCDLEGFKVTVGSQGGAVVPESGGGVSGEGISTDGDPIEFLLQNMGELGVVVVVTPVLGPDPPLRQGRPVDRG